MNEISLDINEFKNYYLDHNYNENMFKEDESINLDYNSCKCQYQMSQKCHC